MSAILLMLAVLIQTPSASTPPPLAGHYTCTGANDHGTRYSLRLEIRAHRDGFLFQWTAPRTGQITGRGLGIRTGDTLAVAFTNGKAIGVVHYAIGNGVLAGRWWAGGEAYPETCEQVETQQASTGTQEIAL